MGVFIRFFPSVLIFLTRTEATSTSYGQLKSTEERKERSMWQDVSPVVVLELFDGYVLLGLRDLSTKTNSCTEC